MEAHSLHSLSCYAAISEFRIAFLCSTESLHSVDEKHLSSEEQLLGLEQTSKVPWQAAAGQGDLNIYWSFWSEKILTVNNAG